MTTTATLRPTSGSERPCAHCGNLARMRKDSRFCSIRCGLLCHDSARESNPAWAGDSVTYSGRHARVYRERGKASQYACVECAEAAAEWAQIHGTDGLDPSDYKVLCVLCHRAYDTASRLSIQGSKNPFAKLNEDIVLDCRRRYWTSPGDSQTALAREYGISPETMRQAVLGITWRQLPMPPPWSIVQ